VSIVVQDAIRFAGSQSGIITNDRHVDPYDDHRS
jgi:hypothetical protein